MISLQIQIMQVDVSEYKYVLTLITCLNSKTVSTYQEYFKNCKTLDEWKLIVWLQKYAGKNSVVLYICHKEIIGIIPFLKD